MKRLELRPLTPDLLDDVLQLDRDCLGGLWTRAGYQREIDSPNSDMFVLCGESETATSPTPDRLHASRVCPHPVLGMSCLWAIADEAHITLLAVDPAYRHQGLGQVLLYAMLATARRRGLQWATLEVRVSNEVAIALYRKFGFQDVGRRRRYYQDTNEDALILWLNRLQERDFAQQLQTWSETIHHCLHLSGWQLHYAQPLQFPQPILT